MQVLQLHRHQRDHVPRHVHAKYRECRGCLPLVKWRTNTCGLRAISTRWTHVLCVVSFVAASWPCRDLNVPGVMYACTKNASSRRWDAVLVSRRYCVTATWADMRA